jgi:hypothetical protein
MLQLMSCWQSAVVCHLGCKIQPHAFRALVTMRECFPVCTKLTTLTLPVLLPPCLPQGVSWNLGVTAAELISSGAIPPCVCVAIDSAGPYR